MKLLFAVTTTLFATSASAKMGEQRSLHAKVDALESEVAELKALLMGASHAAPQGKKNLRRALEDDLVIDSNATTTEEDGTPEEKADALVAQFGFAGALKKLLVDMNPVYNCLGFDEVTNTCSFENEFVDIVAQEGINIDAGDSEDGGNIEIHAEQGMNDDVDGSVLIKGNTGSIEISSDDGITLDADGIALEAIDDIILDTFGEIDIDGFKATISADKILIDGDDSVDIIAGDDDDGTVLIKSAGDIDIKAGVDADDDTLFTGGNVKIEAFDGGSANGDIDLGFDGAFKGNGVEIDVP